MSTGAVVSLLLRVLASAALACAGIVTAGLPAAAEVTEWRVQSPPAGGIVAFAEPLVVEVDRAASPPEEQVEVRTRMLNELGDPVSETVVVLELTDREEREAPPESDRLRYTGTIDPNNFAWLDGAIAPNGNYTLQVQLQVTTGDMQRDPTDWRSHPLVLDAEPQPATSVTAAVKNVDKRRMTVSWEPSPTPDISHYIVERRLDGGPWTLAQDNVEPGTTKVVDPVDDYGDYRYRVLAARRSGDGSQLRLAESEPTSTVELEAAPEPAPVQPAPDRGADEQGNPGGGSGSRPAAPTQPRIQAPIDANQTYKGPLDYGVEVEEVTERVPVKVAKGGGVQEGGVLEVVDRSVDPQRILPAVAGGLILVLSAAHVVRFLNE